MSHWERKNTEQEREKKKGLEGRSFDDSLEAGNDGTGSGAAAVGRAN